MMLGFFKKNKIIRITGDEIIEFMKAEGRFNGNLATAIELPRLAEFELRRTISERLDRRASDFPPLAEYEGIGIHMIPQETGTIALVWQDERGEVCRRIELNVNR